MKQLYSLRQCLITTPTIGIRMLSSQSSFDLRVQNQVVDSDSSSNEVRGGMVGQYVMNGGVGPNSYAQNSSYQGGVIDVAKPIIEEEISTKLDIKHISSWTFRIADFGCSTGHNSFAAMQIITEAVKRKLGKDGKVIEIPDFQVFFNDKVTNDFNTLFSSLPRQRLYHATGVPGSFHGRLLPRASLHFAYSCFSLHWLSEVPKAVLDNTSPAWNRGKVHYFGARREVCEEYANQYAKDIESFLDCRAEELVPGGLMALLVPASWDPHSAYTVLTEVYLLGSCLVDMPKNGRFKEDKVDSFNYSVYFPVPHEFEAIIERNENYTMERMEILDNPGKRSLAGPEERASYLRAVNEGMLVNHFGSEIMDELFDRYANKLKASPLFSNPDSDKTIVIFVLLRRKSEPCSSDS